MPIITLLIIVLIAIAAFWLISLITADARVKLAIQIVVAIIFIIWLLSAAGMLPAGLGIK